MFKISPIETKEEQKEIIESLGGVYREDYFAYAMRDNESGALMGASQFEISKGSGYISDLREPEGLSDFEAMFILARQTMNFIDLCEVHTCYADNSSAPKDFLKAVGFKEADGKFVCNTEGMFSGNCGCHNFYVRYQRRIGC